jgi:anaphase-promoting complex subunit 1
MVDRGLDAEWVAGLPCGIAMPILEILRVCQASPGKDWSPKMYVFAGRNDLAVQTSGEAVLSRDALGVEVRLAMKAWEYTDLFQLDPQIPLIGDLMSATDTDGKSKVIQPSQPHVRFGQDRRLAEVERIMQTSRGRTISVATSPNAR